MPDPGPAGWLLDVLFDAGPLQQGGMEPAPLDYLQLRAWQECHGVVLSPWECGTLRTLSRLYHHTRIASTDPLVAAPGSEAESPEDQTDRRERVSNGLGAQLRAMAQAWRGR